MPSTSPSLESRKPIFSLTELICWGLTPAFPPEKDVRLILQPYLLFSPSQPTRSRRPMPDSIKTLKQFYTSSLMARFVVFVSSSFMTSLLLLLSTFKRLPERGLDWCSPDKGWLKNGLGGLFYGHLVCTRQHLLGWDRSSEWTHPRWKAGIDADLFADNQNSWQEDTDLVNEPIIHAWRGREGFRFMQRPKPFYLRGRLTAANLQKLCQLTSNCSFFTSYFLPPIKTFKWSARK